MSFITHCDRCGQPRSTEILEFIPYTRSYYTGDVITHIGYLYPPVDICGECQEELKLLLHRFFEKKEKF